MSTISSSLAPPHTCKFVSPILHIAEDALIDAVDSVVFVRNMVAFTADVVTDEVVSEFAICRSNFGEPEILAAGRVVNQ